MAEKNGSLMELLYEHRLFRAFMRALRVAVPTGMLVLISVLAEDSVILQNYVWLVPLLVAADKFIRDWLNERGDEAG